MRHLLEKTQSLHGLGVSFSESEFFKGFKTDFEDLNRKRYFPQYKLKELPKRQK